MQDNLSVFPARSAPRTEPELNLTKVRLYNLPAQLTPLIGREQEIQGACMLLQQPEIRLLTLTGTGGVGKTRLSLHIAEELLDNFADGVSFVSLAPISDPNLVVPTIAQTLDLKEAPDWSPLEHLKTYLYKKHCLLLLDNFEQVVTAAPVLVELLQSCLNLKMLVTSRTVLRISGENEFPVPLLTVPDLKHLLGNEALTGYAAVALFVQRARAIKPDFQLTSANARTVAEICIRLDGLPLAIELAAARIKLLSPQALLVRLSHRLQILTGGVRDAPIRQQTLRNTIAWSYDLLSAEEQRLFRRLSVFIDGCTLEAAEGVCNAANDLGMEVLERVASLIDKSLLQQVEQEGEEPRLVMLETIREYGLECLVASGEMEITRSVHAHYYLILAETAEPQLSGSQQVEWLERLERELDNLRAAMQWLVMRGEAEHAMEAALRMGGALGGFWEARGLWSEGWNILEQMLSSEQGSSASVRAKTLNAAANLATMRGDNDQAEELCMESLTLYRALGDKRGIASSLSLLGYVAKERGQLALAHSLNEEALALSRTFGDREGILSGLLALGSLAIQQGEDARARVLLEESLTVSRKQGNKSTLAQSLYMLARVVSLSQGDPATVRSLLAEALVLDRELGDSESTANTLSISGEVALDQGDVATADALLKESMSHPEICKR